jgi:hypothetical protein
LVNQADAAWSSAGVVGAGTQATERARAGRILADRTLPRRARYDAGFELLSVDKCGFDRLGRREAQR